ncbi:MAG: RelA/SpoT family protein [Spirochaetota bacterium]
MPEIELKIKSRDYNTLLDSIRENRPDADFDLISRAYSFAEKKHVNQKRLSGEPYIVHPLEVGIILSRLKMDSITITAALLHDVVEDTETPLSDIETLFGKDVAALVDGVTKISSLKKKTRSHDQAQTLRKMLMATIEDPRVIVIKLADKTHNMRTIMFQPPHKQERMAHEVLDIYAPLAGRLGMSKIRSELEDLAFKVLLPGEYQMIKGNLAERRDEIEDYIENIRQLLKGKLAELSIRADITGRVKHYYSIHRKMEMQSKSFDEIFDIRAIRIITDQVKDCYGILGIVHTLWSPVPSRFKDYIAVPKSNMYQSLHTTVVGPGNHFLEIQIRTLEMDITAEMGIAAHWAYKENSKLPKKEIALLTDINRWREELKNTREFMADLKMELYQEEIFVVTPNGKIVKLAKGATPIDFAFAIHTEIGYRCVGAKVNGKLIPLKTELQNGDIVEVVTGTKGHPSETWLKFAKSSNARQKIRQWIRKNAAEKTGDKNDDEDKPDKKEKRAEVSIPEQELLRIRQFTKKNRTGVIVEGTSNVLIKLSQCCQPIPGDEIIGFVTRGRGITVHKKNCPSLTRLSAEKERFIKIIWSDTHATTYPVKIAVHAHDRPNLLRDLADKLAELKTNIIKMDAQTDTDGAALFKIVLEVKSLDHVIEITKELKNIRNISKVYKLNEKVMLK